MINRLRLSANQLQSEMHLLATQKPHINGNAAAPHSVAMAASSLVKCQED